MSRKSNLKQHPRAAVWWRKSINKPRAFSFFLSPILLVFSHKKPPARVALGSRRRLAGSEAASQPASQARQEDELANPAAPFGCFNLARREKDTRLARNSDHARPNGRRDSGSPRVDTKSDWLRARPRAINGGAARASEQMSHLARAGRQLIFAPPTRTRFRFESDRIGSDRPRSKRAAGELVSGPLFVLARAQECIIIMDRSRSLGASLGASSQAASKNKGRSQFIGAAFVRRPVGGRDAAPGMSANVVRGLIGAERRRRKRRRKRERRLWGASECARGPSGRPVRLKGVYSGPGRAGERKKERETRFGANPFNGSREAERAKPLGGLLVISSRLLIWRRAAELSARPDWRALDAPGEDRDNM